MFPMRFDLEQTDCVVILAYVAFAFNTTLQGRTPVTKFGLVYGWETTTTHGAMLPNVAEDNLYAVVSLQHTEVAPRLAWLRDKA